MRISKLEADRAGERHNAGRGFCFAGNRLSSREIGMKVASNRLDLYRSLYWANQGLLHAVRALQEAELPTLSSPPSALLTSNLRRTQAMIEETRVLMNDILGEWIEGPQ